MKADIFIDSNSYSINLQEGIDLSIPFRNDGQGVLAWYLNHPVFKPVIGEGFVGEVKQGGSVNFFDLTINPHGQGTHTECVGHISDKQESINQNISSFFALAHVITVSGSLTEQGMQIGLEEVQTTLVNPKVKAVIFRTSPNPTAKRSTNYSNAHAPFLAPELAAWLREFGIEHLLIDQPSVDPEEDGGALAAHHAFWNYPKATCFEKTITELIYVPNEVKDGLYILNLQVAPIENDAAPSRPLIYKLD